MILVNGTNKMSNGSEDCECVRTFQNEKGDMAVEFKVKYATINPQYHTEWLKGVNEIPKNKLHMLVDFNSQSNRYNMSGLITKEEIKERVETIMELWKQHKPDNGIY